MKLPAHAYAPLVSSQRAHAENQHLCHKITTLRYRLDSPRFQLTSRRDKCDRRLSNHARGLHAARLNGSTMHPHPDQRPASPRCQPCRPELSACFFSVVELPQHATQAAQSENLAAHSWGSKWGVHGGRPIELRGSEPRGTSASSSNDITRNEHVHGS